MTYAEPAARTGITRCRAVSQPAGRKGCSVSEGAERCAFGQRVSGQDTNRSQRPLRAARRSLCVPWPFCLGETEAQAERATYVDAQSPI